MSQLIKLGAQAITDDMMIDIPEDEREKALSWHAGFYAGLYEAEMLTEEELSQLLDDLKWV